MKAKFKVGDTVRLKKNLIAWDDYDEITMLVSMFFDGEKTVGQISQNDKILLESWPYYYSPSMLVRVPKKKARDV